MTNTYSDSMLPSLRIRQATSFNGKPRTLILKLEKKKWKTVKRGVGAGSVRPETGMKHYHPPVDSRPGRAQRVYGPPARESSIAEGDELRLFILWLQRRRARPCKMVQTAASTRDRLSLISHRLRYMNTHYDAVSCTNGEHPLFPWTIKGTHARIHNMNTFGLVL